jgi:C4-dicarboxylate-specific signal transduction histidine kinase
MLGTTGLQPDVQRRIDAISAETARATSLISALQAYVHADRDPVPVIDLWTVVDRAVSMRSAALRRLRITLIVKGDGRSPAPVAGPGSRLLQIALDLLLEAERLLRGRSGPTISVTVDAAGESFALRVSAAGDITEQQVAEARAEDVLTADAQLWTASSLAKRVGGSVTVASTNGNCDWTLSMPAAASGKT